MDESASSWPTPAAPHCPNTGPRPGWLLSKWHCGQDHELDDRYGIRCEDYWRLLEIQGGRCALCGFRPRQWRLVVHHDHEPPYEVVALLHFPCNQIIDWLLWLLPRLLTLALDPPARRLGLRVPTAKARRLETKDQAKRERAQRRAENRKAAKAQGNGKATTGIRDQIKAMTKQGG